MVEKKEWKFWKIWWGEACDGASRTGTPFLLAKDISKSITSKDAQKSPIDNFIYSSKVREYITEELKQRNHDSIAESFSGYSKNNVTPMNEEQLKNNKYDSKVSPSVNTHSKQYVKDKDSTTGCN